MNRRLWSLLAAPLLLVAALLVGYVGPHKVLAQGIPPSGSFGFLLNQWSNAPLQTGGVVGVINFDGAGRVTGSFTQYPVSQTLNFNGTYSSNPNGTGSMNVTDDSGSTTQFAMVITNGGSQISLLATSGDIVMTGVASRQ